MSAHRKQHPGQIGPYWPANGVAGSPYYYRFWWDNEARRTRRESLGVTTFEEACEKLAEWHAHNVVLRRVAPSEARLADVFTRYWLDHGQNVASASSIRVHLRTVLEMVEGDPFISEFGYRAQEMLLRRLNDRYAPGAVKRTFGTVKAAVIWAWRREMITAHPPFIVDIPDGEPRERIMSVVELARLWDAAEQPHAQAFIMAMMATLARPAAVLELTRFQCDLIRGTVDLNPAGKERTKKRRPVVPLVDAFRSWVTRSAGHIIEYRGKPVRKINAVFRNVRKAAGLGEDVVPYTIRHSMASELLMRGVPDVMISAMLGHTKTIVKTTDRYAKYRVEWLREARDAIDVVIREVSRLAGRDTIPVNFATK